MRIKILYQFIAYTLILFLFLPGQSAGQTDCTVEVSNCPPADLSPVCATTVVNGILGAYVYWTPPDFTLTCPGGANGGFDFFTSFNLPESQNECWLYNKVQRTGLGSLRLWQSTGTDFYPHFTTPAFYLPNGATEGSFSFINGSGKNLTCNIYLIYPDGSKSPLNTSFTIFGTKDYNFWITPPQEGIYRLFFEFTGNGSNKDFINLLKINSPLYGASCVGAIDFSLIADHYPGEFFPVGSTPVTYTATCNSCTPRLTETCSFNVVVNGVTASATKTDASCALNNGTITITATSSNTTPALQYNINNGGWVNFTSPVTITGLAQGIKTINVRDYFSNNSSYCQILSPITLTINRIVDNIRPVINCPPNLNIQGCSASAITAANSGFAYSPVQQIISLAQFSSAGGSASDNCAITSIKYQDTSTGLCPTVTRTFIVSDASGNTASCTQTIAVQDRILPNFTALNQEFCVSNIANASFYMTTIPDWYLFKAGSTELDVAGLTDNCTSSSNLKLQWQIIFSDGTFISGIGQPSTYGSDILFKGSAGIDTKHQIIYRLTDLCGNETVKNCSITIHPRSEVNSL